MWLLAGELSSRLCLAFFNLLAQLRCERFNYFASKKECSAPFACVNFMTRIMAFQALQHRYVITLQLIRHFSREFGSHKQANWAIVITLADNCNREKSVRIKKASITWPWSPSESPHHWRSSRESLSASASPSDYRVSASLLSQFPALHLRNDEFRFPFRFHSFPPHLSFLPTRCEIEMPFFAPADKVRAWTFRSRADDVVSFFCGPPSRLPDIGRAFHVFATFAAKRFDLWIQASRW